MFFTNKFTLNYNAGFLPDISFNANKASKTTLLSKTGRKVCPGTVDDIV